MPVLDSLRAWATLPRLVPILILELQKAGRTMADVSPILNKLAEDLRAYGSGPLAALVAENTALKSRNAELEGEDAAESSAAQNAVDAFNELAAPVSESPEVPVEIPEVEVPTETDDTPPASAF